MLSHALWCGGQLKPFEIIVFLVPVVFQMCCVRFRVGVYEFFFLNLLNDNWSINVFNTKLPFTFEIIRLFEHKFH